MFKQYTERKDDIDIRVIFEKGTASDAECDTEEVKTQQDILWARSEYHTEPETIEIDEMMQLYNRYFQPKKPVYFPMKLLLGQTV